LSALEQWIDVRVIVPSGWEELVAEALTTGPCTTIAFGRSSLAADPTPAGFESVRTCYPGRHDSPALRREIEASVARLAELADAPELAELRVEFRVLPAEDYASSWKKTWKPFRVGRLCVVRPDGAQRLNPDDVRLVLEPGGAFGTGRHTTTRMCLAVLQARVRPGTRILDAGCGNGILAVSAVVLGARSAVGFDLDPNAEPYARELAAMNGVQDRCEFESAGFEFLAGCKSEYDAVLANIYSDIIQEHASTLARALASGGWFAFSGCPIQHAEKTSAAIRAAGLEIEDVRVRGRWHTYSGRKAR
jgi:ribosomal protein L11 methyltransferase